MQKPQFVNGEIYHIYNRGVEKRNIFMDDEDRFRFIHDLYEFNDENSSPNVLYYFNSRLKDIESIFIEKEKTPRKLLVEILLFVFMPNHVHLLLRQKREKGIVKFMQKIGTGYTNYFNKKYERVGSLFQGRFKAVLVKEQAHFLHLPFYIHTNPINNYRGSGSTIKFLENYRWSSYMDYIGKKNFPSITSREFLLRFWGNPKEYQQITKKWLENKNKNTETINKIILEEAI